jgi:hypothetical protein
MSTLVAQLSHFGLMSSSWCEEVGEYYYVRRRKGKLPSSKLVTAEPLEVENVEVLDSIDNAFATRNLLTLLRRHHPDRDPDRGGSG